MPAPIKVGNFSDFLSTLLCYSYKSTDNFAEKTMDNYVDWSAVFRNYPLENSDNWYRIVQNYLYFF